MLPPSIPETGLIFASTREGMVHIFHEDSPEKFSEVETIKTEYGAKTMGLDIKTHKLFPDTADFGPAPAPTADRPHPQRTAIQGNVSRTGLRTITTLRANYLKRSLECGCRH